MKAYGDGVSRDSVEAENDFHVAAPGQVSRNRTHDGLIEPGELALRDGGEHVDIDAANAARSGRLAAETSTEETDIDLISCAAKVNRNVGAVWRRVKREGEVLGAAPIGCHAQERRRRRTLPAGVG